MAGWEKQREGTEWLHLLPIDEDHTWHVYRTAGGDYAVVCYADGDPCGGDPEYGRTLKEAKGMVERIMASGNWRAYTLDETSSLR